MIRKVLGQVLLGLCFGGCAPALAATDLFESEQTLELLIEAPMDQLMRQRRDRPVVDARVTYTDADGAERTLTATLTTRGYSRLDYCWYPPMKLNFKKKELKPTMFKGHDKLKLVTQCKASRKYQRYLQQEYGVYRANNAITDFSFRVRYLSVTYRDTEGKRKEVHQPGFFIEDMDSLVKRLGVVEGKLPALEIEDLDPFYATESALFHYLIGDTDWSTLEGPEGDTCCHNGKPVINDRGQWRVIPYDFDRSGVVNAEYAVPNSTIPIKNVKQRLFRGLCVHNDQLPAAIRHLNGIRPAIEEALVVPILDKYGRSRVMKYIDGFYQDLNDPERLEKRIVGRCRAEDPEEENSG